MPAFSRRSFLKYSTIAGAGLALPSLAVTQNYLPDSVLQKNRDFAGDKGTPLAPGLVQEFVRFSHFNLEYVKQAVAAEPRLIYASWDWGGGDYETGLGAASHVGNRAIAEFLLEQGARPTLFSAAMLGQLEVVKAYLTATPELIACEGPHGLSLIHHAEMGGAAAAETLAYLEMAGGQ